MAFLIHSTADGHQVPWEYVPCSAMQPSLGMALVLSSGKLAAASATQKPEFISMYDAPATLSAGDIIPVIRVTEDIIFETTNSASLSGVNIGTAVRLSDATKVSANDSSGVAEIVEKDGDAVGSRVLVKF